MLNAQHSSQHVERALQFAVTITIIILWQS